VNNFWQSIRDCRPPKPDHYTSTGKALRLLHPSVIEDKTIDLTGDNELPDLCERAMRLADERKRIVKEEDEVENCIRAKIGDARFALVADGIRISHSIGKDTAPRPAMPGEMVGGRKGSDRLTVSKQKPSSSKRKAA
jgi:hypothetical protein